MIAEDGLYAANDFPAAMPELAAPPRKGFRWEPPADALTREQYLAIGRPLLIAAGFLQANGAEVVKDEPVLPPMPNSGKRRKAPAKVKAVPTPKKEGIECPF